MAKEKTTTVTQVIVNNAKASTTVNKTVELVVVDNQLVPDIRELNPGVINK